MNQHCGRVCASVDVLAVTDTLRAPLRLPR
jgi:hypothetical protein